MLTTSQQIATREIQQHTHTLGGRIRIVELERIDSKTGHSTRLRGSEMFRDPETAKMLCRITERANHYSPTVTDGGLRFSATERFATWYVYSY
jgi:hypothetical protein